MPISQLKDDWLITERWLFSIAMPFCHIFFVDLSINNNYLVNWMEELHLYRLLLELHVGHWLWNLSNFKKAIGFVRYIHLCIVQWICLQSTYLQVMGSIARRIFDFMNCNTVLRIDISSKSIPFWHFKVKHMLEFMNAKEYRSFGLYANLYPKCEGT